MRDHQFNENLVPQRIRRGRAVLVGYGLDDADGHVRYTRGSSLLLMGGSDNVHSEMQKRAQNIQERLDRLGITLEGMTYEQYLTVRRIVDEANGEQEPL